MIPLLSFPYLFLSLDCNSLRREINEFKYLIPDQLKIDVIFLQETFSPFVTLMLLNIGHTNPENTSKINYRHDCFYLHRICCKLYYLILAVSFFFPLIFLCFLALDREILTKNENCLIKARYFKKY